MPIIHSILKLYGIPNNVKEKVTLEMLHLLAPKLNVKPSKIKTVKDGSRILIKEYRKIQILNHKFNQPIYKDILKEATSLPHKPAGGVSGIPQVQAPQVVKFMGGFQANAPTGVQPHELKSALEAQSEFLQSEINKLQQESVDEFLKGDDLAQQQWEELIKEPEPKKLPVNIGKLQQSSVNKFLKGDVLAQQQWDELMNDNSSIGSLDSINTFNTGEVSQNSDLTTPTIPSNPFSNDL